MSSKDKVYKTCEMCVGHGWVEVGPECDKPASMCCGGCYRKEKCDECNGSGKEKIAKTYYILFGEEAVSMAEKNATATEIRQAYEDGDIMYDTFKFEEGVSSIGELLSSFMGWYDYAFVSEQEYNILNF